MTDTPDFPALVELAQRLEGKDRKTCELALYTLKKQDERLAKKGAKITALEELVDYCIKIAEEDEGCSCSQMECLMCDSGKNIADKIRAALEGKW